MNQWQRKAIILGFRTMWVSLALTVAAYAFGHANADEGKENRAQKRVSEKELPAPVLEAFKKEHPKAHIEAIKIENEEDKEYFEIESREGSAERRLFYSDNGVLVKSEESIRQSDLPRAVVKTISEAYPGGKISSAERITRGDVVHYEVWLKSSEHDYDLFLSDDGKFVPSDESSEGAVDDD